MLDAHSDLDCSKADMKKTIFAVLAAVAVIATGCVKTVSDTNAFATTWGKDTVAGRVAQVTEEYDLGVSTNAHYWQLDLSQGWKPAAAERTT